MSAEVPVSDLGCCARQTGSDREAWIIREATKKDVPVICRLVRDLARHVGSEREVVLSQEALEPALFGEDPSVRVLVAEMDGRVVGFASWFRTFSTWTGRGGIYLEDLFLLPEARGRGIGSGFLRKLARVASDRGYGRMEWTVVRSNIEAQGFYRNLGAKPLHQLQMWRISGKAVAALADGEAQEGSAQRFG
jgi:GNAT superfamily N-acetyltransferase